MEEKIFEIIGMNCEHFAGIPIKCSRKLAREITIMFIYYSDWLLKSDDTIISYMVESVDEYQLHNYLFDYWYNKVYKK